MEKLKERWKAPTPKFWKKVRNASMLISLLALIVALFPISPGIVAVVGSYASVGGMTASLLAQLTKEDGKLDFSNLEMDDLISLASSIRKLENPSKEQLGLLEELHKQIKSESNAS